MAAIAKTTVAMAAMATIQGLNGLEDVLSESKKSEKIWESLIYVSQLHQD